MSAKKNLIEMIKAVQNNGGNSGFGVGTATKEDLEQLLALADENGNIEIGGATVRILSGEDISEDMLEQIKEDAVDLGKIKSESRPRLSILSNQLEKKETQRNVKKLIDFLDENDMDFVDLLSAVTVIGIAGYSEETIGFAGIETEEDYFEYLDSIQTEMKATQALIPTTPVARAEDFIPSALLMALSVATCDEKVMEHMLFMHRLAMLHDKDEVERRANKKFEMTTGVYDMGEKSLESDATSKKLEKLFKKAMGESLDEAFKKAIESMAKSGNRVC